MAWGTLELQPLVSCSGRKLSQSMYLDNLAEPTNNHDNIGYVTPEGCGFIFVLDCDGVLFSEINL